MTRFSLKDLFIGITFVAIGIPMLRFTVTKNFDGPVIVPLAVFVTGAALVGVGVLMPFKLTLNGAVLMFAAVFFAVIILLLSVLARM